VQVHDRLNLNLKPALVKVLDFGLAKLSETAPGEHQSTATAQDLTAQDALVGTVPYMSPEQVEHRDLDTCSSVFQFKGQTPEVREVGRRLNVDTVLEGSVPRGGERLRVTAQSVKTTDSGPSATNARCGTRSTSRTTSSRPSSTSSRSVD
jgi:serine/threonine protein kinase